MESRADSRDTIAEIYNRFKRVGAAIGRVNGNNTHSGNISMRDPADSDLFYVTSTGSQCAALIPRDIVPIRFSGVSWGDARGSTESTIHRKLLTLPGVNSAIHAHLLSTTGISFDTKENNILVQYLGVDGEGRDEFLFHPVDLLGSYIVGDVRVGSYYQPVGSAEMEERIPQYLSKDKLTIVRGHGPFVRASSPEEALHLLSVLDSSAKLVIFLRRRGVDVIGLQRYVAEKWDGMFRSAKPGAFEKIEFSVCELDDETLIEDFRQRLNYNYDNQLGAFATGSMSQKISAGEMIYCPMSAVPEDFEFPLYRIPIQFREEDSAHMKMHKLIYQHTHQNSCMITTSPMATAEGMVTLAQKFGKEVLMGDHIDISYRAADHPMVLPIDAEAIYLNPRVGLVDILQLFNMTPQNPILNMLRWHKGCCIVSGYGVISTGDTTLEQAAHNAASAERIAHFRAEVYINKVLAGGPPVNAFEPKTT